MSTAIYARHSDEIGHLATVSLPTGTAHASYPVTNVQTFDPMEIFLTTDGDGARIVWDHGSAVDVQGFSLHHHNIPAGTTGVKVERNATNSWTSPTISYEPTIATHPNTGLPLPIGVDLRTVAGYSGSGFRYSSLLVPPVGSPGQRTGLGSVLWWQTLREDLTNVRYPVQDAETHPTRSFRTAFGRVRSYRLGVRLRRQPSTFLFRTASIFASFETLFRGCQEANGNAFLWWRDPSTSDAWLAGFSVPDLARQITPVFELDVVLEELGCGVAIPT